MKHTAFHTVSFGRDRGTEPKSDCEFRLTQLINIEKKKSPHTFAHVVHNSKNVSAIFYHNRSTVFLFWLYNKKNLSHVLAALSVFLALFTWSRRTTCAKIIGCFFILITHKSRTLESAITRLKCRGLLFTFSQGYQCEKMQILIFMILRISVVVLFCVA